MDAGTPEQADERRTKRFIIVNDGYPGLITHHDLDGQYPTAIPSFRGSLAAA